MKFTKRIHASESTEHLFFGTIFSNINLFFTIFTFNFYYFHSVVPPLPLFSRVFQRTCQFRYNIFPILLQFFFPFFRSRVTGSGAGEIGSGVAVGSGVGVGVGETGSGVAVGSGVGVGVGETGSGVAVGSGVRVGAGVGVGVDEVELGAGVAAGSDVRVGAGVGVGVDEVELGAGVAAGSGVRLGAGVGVGVDEVELDAGVAAGPGVRLGAGVGAEVGLGAGVEEAGIDMDIDEAGAEGQIILYHGIPFDPGDDEFGVLVGAGNKAVSRTFIFTDWATVSVSFD